MTIIVLAIKRRAFSFLAPIFPALIFFALYVLGASAYQGNMGTGFRHKSLILWVVLLVLFALAWKKADGSEQNPRNNSQESAV
jgi:VIT1/CCC1 family predicted Fe2+/Mn2+ transporter